MDSSPFCGSDPLPTINEGGLHQSTTPNCQDPAQQQQQLLSLDQLLGARPAARANSTGSNNSSDFTPLRATQSTSVLDLQHRLDK
jgi:hypothetical protein